MLILLQNIQCVRHRLQMEQIAQAERVPIGAFVDREQRDELVRLARERRLIVPIRGHDDFPRIYWTHA
jgi:hypothetical protein